MHRCYFDKNMSGSGKTPIKILGLFFVVCLLQAILLILFVCFFKTETTVSFGRSLEVQKVNAESSSTSSTLFVAVLSHSKRKERRDAIRQTWMTLCDKSPKDIFCRFFTDEVGLDNNAMEALRQERKEHSDIEILNATDSFAFAERLLLIWDWSKKRSLRYEYFLRIDDDHYLCVDRMIHEIDYRPKSGLYWGFVHCHPRVVRVDEAWLLLSFDLIEEIMIRKENRSLLCSPYGDQAVAMWVNLSKQNITYFMDNKRIVHKSAGRNPLFFQTNLCKKYLSLHGVYPRSMKQFWTLSHTLHKKTQRTITYDVPAISNFSTLCSFSPQFEYTGFIKEFQFKPQLCHLHPKWRISEVRHAGREEEGERYSNY